MELFSLPKIDSDLTAWFILYGKEYEMSQFSISFGQSVDHKGCLLYTSDAADE